MKLSRTDDQRESFENTEADLTKLPIPQIVSELWSSRRRLATISGIFMVLAIGAVLLMPNQYTSVAQLMPQDQQTYATASTLTVLTGSGAMGGGSFLSTRTPGQVTIGILKSVTVQNDIIKRFDLLNVYHCKFYVDARAILTAKTIMDEDKSTGIVSIGVEDRDRYLARDIVKAYIEDLNRLLNEKNTSSAHLERVFLEDRLASLKGDMDNISKKLSEFSSQHNTLNPASQAQALIQNEANLQGQLITAQSQLYSLKAQYSNDNVRVRSAQALVDELRNQLRKMGDGDGSDKPAETDHHSNEEFPSIHNLPTLGTTYNDLARELAMQQGISDILTRQYELAIVQEAKELPVVRTLDQPDVAEKKSSPHRATIVILVGLVSFILSALWIAVRKFWQLVTASHPAKAVVLSTMESLREQA